MIRLVPLGCVAALALAGIIPALTHAQTWALDPSVAPLIYRESPALANTAFAPLADGRRLIYGNFSHVNGLAAPGLARLGADDDIDPTFVADLSGNERVAVAASLSEGRALVALVTQSISPLSTGTLGMSGYGSAPPPVTEITLTRASDGSLTNAGIPVDPPASTLLRLRTDGRRDPSFLPLTCDGTPHLSPLPDGRILVWGSFRTLGGMARNGLARLHSDGTLDPGFVPAFTSTPVRITAAAPAPDGSLVVSGYTYGANFQPISLFKRLDANGVVDPSFTPTERVLTLLVVQADGSILAGDSRLTRYSPTGVIDANFSPTSLGAGDDDASRKLRQVAPLSTGQLVITTEIVLVPVSSLPSPPLFRQTFLLRADGSVERELTTLAGARLVAPMSGPPALLVQIGDTLANVSATGTVTPLPTTVTLRTPATVSRLETDAQDRVVITGSFTHIDGQARPGLARFLATGALDRVFVPPSGTLLFIPPDGRPVIRQNSSAPLRLRDDGTPDPSFMFPAGLDPGKTRWLAGHPDGRLLVSAFDPDDSREENLKLIWLAADGRRLATLPPTFKRYARWNPGGIVVGFDPLGMPTGNGSVVIAGRFEISNRLDAAQLLPDGRLLVAGGFYYVDDLLRPGLAWLKSDGSVDGPRPPPLDPDAPPVATAVFSDFPSASLLALPDGRALLFPGANGPIISTLYSRRVLRLLDDGSVDPTFQPPAETVMQGTRALADGSFFSAGRRFDRDGWPDLNYRPQVRQGAATSSAATAVLSPSGHFWIAGAFTSVDGHPRTALARFIPTEVVGISAAPQSQTVVAGRNATLTVALGTTQSATYSWTRDGITLPGATNSRLLLENVRTEDSGTYRTVVTVAGQVLTSEPAALTISANTSRFINFSARTFVTPGTPQVAGFVLAPAPPRQTLLRAIGYGAPGTDGQTLLRVPVLSLFDPVTAVAQDRHSAILPPIVDLASKVGAFRIVPNGTLMSFGVSYGAALAPTLGSGAFTAQTTSGDTSSGASLFEFYDTGSVSTPPLVRNVSIRGQISANFPTFTAGFVIAGNGPLRVLVRGIGPTLATFGVADALRDPIIYLLETRTASSSAQNSGWDDDPAIAAIAARAGAFPLSLGSRDSALFMTLEPGAYTAQLSSASGATGAAMIELYVVDF